MSCYFTLKGLWTLRHGNGAPLWRTVATLESSTLINVISALVVAVAVGYVVRRVALYRFANRDDVRCSGEWYLGVLFPFLAALAFFVSPPLLSHVWSLSPFLFSLVFPVLSLAFMVSLAVRPKGRQSDSDEDSSEDTRRFLSLRLAVSGLLAAIGAWESTLGAVFALIAPFLTLLWPIRRENSVGRVAGVWLVGFVAGFAAEAHWLPACSWLSLSPTVPPIMLAFVFVATGILPMSLIIRFGTKLFLLVAWGVTLLICVVWFAYRTAVVQTSACETFVRRCLAELGDRKLVVSDGFFDDAFRELAPGDVRVVGTHTVDDREFLINSFSENESFTNQALIVSHCYAYPEFPAAAQEAGIALRKTTTSEQKPKNELSEAEKEKFAAAQKEAAAKVLFPVAESLMTMERDFAKIPAARRSAEIEKARMTLRGSWDKGASGLRISSMLLALDMMQGDRRALESDALTALMLDCSDPAANAVLGELRLADGRVDDAERYLRRAVKGEGAMAMCDYARVLVVRGKYAEAESWAHKAIAKRPNDPVMREPLITAFVESRQFEAADREVKTMLELVRDDARRTAQCRVFALNVSKRMRELQKKK